MEYTSKINGIRDAVYRAASNITPDVIVQADKLVSNVTSAGAAVEIGIGIGALALAYMLSKEADAYTYEE